LSVIDVFTAMKTRFDARLAASLNGFFVGDAWANTPRPYLVATPLVESKAGESNKGIYRDTTVETSVLADDPDLVTRLAYLVQSVMTQPALVFTNSANRLMYLEEGDIVWQEQDQYWRATVTFTAKVAKPGRSDR